MFLTALTLGALAASGPPEIRGHADYEPRLAILTGLKCSACHVNRTGGGGRTDYGAVFAQTELPIRNTGYPFRNRAINDWISMGTDLRVLGSAALTSATPQTLIQTGNANVYMEAKLVPDVLTLYLDESFGPSTASSREVFGLVSNLPLNGYAKFGKFILPFGTRVVDDLEFIRSVTGFTMFSPDQGVEVGFEPGPLSLLMSVSNGESGGSEANNAKQVTGSAAWVARQGRLGASGSWNRSGPFTTSWMGGFGGFRVGKLGVLGEVDHIKRTDVSGASLNELVAFVEGNVLVRRGVNAKVTYGFHDSNTNTPNTERSRTRIGVEVFPIPLLQIFGFVTVFDDIQGAVQQANRATVELHFFF